VEGCFWDFEVLFAKTYSIIIESFFVLDAQQKTRRAFEGRLRTKRKEKGGQAKEEKNNEKQVRLLGEKKQLKTHKT